MQISNSDSLSDMDLDVFLPGGDLDYFKSRVFVGIESGGFFTAESLMQTSWQHPKQLIASEYVDGCFILDCLVQGFDSAQIDTDTVYRCRKTDGIQGHLGVSVLESLRKHWQKLPKVFVEWARDKRLYALADTFWGDDGEIYMPVLVSVSDTPRICGHSPNSLIFDKKDVFLKV
jgi:hypothetical protein